MSTSSLHSDEDDVVIDIFDEKQCPSTTTQQPATQQQPSAPTTCSMTAPRLEKQLKQSNFGEDKAHYLCYFMEGMPPRCVTCGETIGAHRAGGQQTNNNQKQQQQKNGKNKNKKKQKQQPKEAFVRPEQAPLHNNVKCILCESRFAEAKAKGELPNIQPMHAIPAKRQVSTKEFYGERRCMDCCWEVEPEEPPVCHECGIRGRVTHPLLDEVRKAEVNKWSEDHGDLRFYQCDTETYVSPYSRGGKRSKRSIRFRCERVVCSRCVQKRQHLREKSRFHHNEPEWKTTSLYGCCDSPELCVSSFLCWYFCHSSATLFEGNSNIFDVVHLKKAINQNSDVLPGIICLVPFCCGCDVISVCSTQMCCCDDCECAAHKQVRRHEKEIEARFGVTPHTDCERKLCGLCVFNRVLREAEARGYPQPTCCTNLRDVDEMVEQYPPHPHEVNAPRPKSLF